MKKSMKILSILLIAVILLANMSTICLAANATQMKPGNIKADYDDLDMNGVSDTAGKVMGLIRNVAVIAGVILIAVLGIKYMLGSVEEKAEYKKSFMPLIIGIILVVSATAIASFIFKLVG